MSLISAYVYRCAGLVCDFVGFRSLCRSNSKTALTMWTHVCDLCDLFWMCWGLFLEFQQEHCNTERPWTELLGLMPALLTCTLTCKNVTRGNHRYLQVCMCECVFYLSAEGGVCSSAIPHIVSDMDFRWIGLWSVKVTFYYTWCW